MTYPWPLGAPAYPPSRWEIGGRKRQLRRSFVPWLEAPYVSNAHRCFVKIFGFWTNPEDGVGHMSLLSNPGMPWREAGPHEEIKGLFCGKKKDLLRCQYKTSGRTTCSPCIRQFEQVMYAYDKWRDRYDTVTSPPVASRA